MICGGNEATTSSTNGDKTKISGGSWTSLAGLGVVGDHESGLRPSATRVCMWTFENMRKEEAESTLCGVRFGEPATD